MRKQETCEDCLLPKSICICGSSNVVYDPVERREELLGMLDNLEELIEAAQKIDPSIAVDPSSGGQ